MCVFCFWSAQTFVCTLNVKWCKSFPKPTRGFLSMPIVPGEDACKLLGCKSCKFSGHGKHTWTHRSKGSKSNLVFPVVFALDQVEIEMKPSQTTCHVPAVSQNMFWHCAVWIAMPWSSGSDSAVGMHGNAKTTFREIFVKWCDVSCGLRSHMWECQDKFQRDFCEMMCRFMWTETPSMTECVPWFSFNNPMDITFQPAVKATQHPLSPLPGLALPFIQACLFGICSCDSSGGEVSCHFWSWIVPLCLVKMTCKKHRNFVTLHFCEWNSNSCVFMEPLVENRICSHSFSFWKIWPCGFLLHFGLKRFLPATHLNFHSQSIVLLWSLELKNAACFDCSGHHFGVLCWKHQRIWFVVTSWRSHFNVLMWPKNGNKTASFTDQKDSTETEMSSFAQECWTCKQNKTCFQLFCVLLSIWCHWHFSLTMKPILSPQFQDLFLICILSAPFLLCFRPVHKQTPENWASLEFCTATQDTSHQHWTVLCECAVKQILLCHVNAPTHVVCSHEFLSNHPKWNFQQESNGIELSSSFQHFSFASLLVAFLIFQFPHQSTQFVLCVFEKWTRLTPPFACVSFHCNGFNGISTESQWRENWHRGCDLNNQLTFCWWHHCETECDCFNLSHCLPKCCVVLSGDMTFMFNQDMDSKQFHLWSQKDHAQMKCGLTGRLLKCDHMEEWPEFCCELWHVAVCLCDAGKFSLQKWEEQGRVPSNEQLAILFNSFCVTSFALPLWCWKQQWQKRCWKNWMDCL